MNEISAIEDNAVTTILNADFGAGASFNPEEDTVVVVTTAPSSVTAPLVTTYGPKIRIIAGSDTPQSAAGGTSDDSAKKHSAKKYFTKKQASAKSVRKAPAPTGK
ncbi:hypothetical protein OG250_41990 [Streptomyces sp. NBC_00487]|uniref:hypothetical protein n=1 Tax=unclassified Streptomyces TaxID=2593676 RepID=UPI002E176730|nr:MULTISPECIES: hypothetical protein [unclassified Streptomyces]